MSYENNKNNNQRCSRCYQTYSGLKATCSSAICNHEYFFKKDGKLLCAICLMQERYIKCEKCRKSITRLEELGRWRGNVVLVDDHSYDLNTFVCECRECNSSENKKNNLKRCQGTFSVHYNGGLGQGGSTQFNQCDFSIPTDGGDFCQHCKEEGQTETFQQGKAKRDSESNKIFKNFEQAHEKAQNYWNSLSSSERERECERIVENLKLGKYSGGEYCKNRDLEFCGAGWACDGSFWIVKNGKYTSESPHLVPVELAEEFAEKEFGESNEKLIELSNYKKVVRNKGDDNPSESSNYKGQIIRINLPSDSPQPSHTRQDEPSERNDDKTLTINLQNARKITLTPEGNLVIEFDDKQGYEYPAQIITPDLINNSQELRKIRSYCQALNQDSLSRQELNGIFITPTDESPNKDNKVIWISCGVGGVLILGIAIILAWKRKRSSKNI